MSIFAYDPTSAKTWGTTIVNYLNGGAESVEGISKKFNEQIEKLVQPNVWTGPAALQNYQNFLETHQALVNFINGFGTTFESAMNELNKSVAALETSNLGNASNISSNFGTLSYNQLSALSQENINKEIVRYDYATIQGIGTSLNTILNTLTTLNERLISEINKLNNGSGIWDGNAAENAKQELTGTLKSCMDKVIEALNICIKNIQGAAEAAQIADGK